MGKGLPASLLMSNLQASLRILAPDYEDLHLLTARLNGLFRHNLKLIKFISMFIARIDRFSNTLWFCNAGHNPAVWWHKEANTIHWLNPTGPAIGLSDKARFESDHVRFGPGDVFVFYTDGLVEAKDPNAGDFGEDRLARLILQAAEAPAQALVNKILDSATRFAGGFHDDVTILVMKVS
jgi:sigma-B regulation protein RsbU (phosphoserine phosphatase)